MIERRTLTAAEVRALPIGSRVTVHSHDAHGFPTRLICEVVQAGKHKELRFDSWDGFGRRPIRSGVKYTMEVSDEK